MDLRSQTSLIAAVLVLALTTSVVLRPKKRRVDWSFGLFGLNVGTWYLSTFLMGLLGDPAWQRVNLVCAVLLPLGAVQFFRAFIAEDDRRMTLLNRVAIASAAVLLGAIFTPLYNHIVVASALFVDVFVFLFASLAVLYARGRADPSRYEGARMRYLALVGALAGVFTLVDYLPYVGLDIPPVGTVLILIFLYVLSQSILRYRLLDLYELAGRLTVLTALSFTLAGILWVLVYFAEGRFFLHAVVAALVLLLLFDPLRNKVEEKISQFFFRERYDLEQSIVELRQRLAHVLEVDEMTRVVLAGIERSRRVTHASIYLLDDDQRGYDLAGHVGPEPARRVELVPARPLLDRLRRDDVLVIETIERELDERRGHREEREAETLYEIVQTMEAMIGSVCLAIRGEQGDLYGLLCVRDERLRDAFSPEEINLLRGLAAQAAIAIENSRLYERMKERDRLAALGEMAAGLAHEIRNPLGAIKASAQYLTEPGAEVGAGDLREFLGIIVEEVDRMNRVVGSFLDYARPSKGHPAPTDVSATVQRTMQLLSPQCAAADVKWRVVFGDDLPHVRIDIEQLRQVLINLVQNAIQAMETGGELVIETVAREQPSPLGGEPKRTVDIRVTDTGPGIPKKVLQNLFVPFVTTKDRGTGLGLAISQRIVTAAGGTIEVRSHAGHGTTFVVRLPAASETTTGSIAPAAPKSDQPPSRTPAAALPPEAEAPAPSAPASSGDAPSAAEAGSETPSGIATSR